MPKASGTSRYSRRTPVPKPATACMPAPVATSAVAPAMMTLVSTVVMEDNSPTCRISRMCRHASGARLSLTTQRPDRMNHSIASAPPTKNSTMATPPPAIPRPGSGPTPKISRGDKGMSSTTPAQVTSAGNSMLPVPRITLASAFINQSAMLPAKTTFEYCSAAASSGPSAPIQR